MKKLTLTRAKELFPPGTRVKWAAHFLRSIADYSHASASRTGTVLDGMINSYSPTFHIVLVKWDDREEVDGVNCSNLIPANKIHLEPV